MLENRKRMNLKTILYLVVCLMISFPMNSYGQEEKTRFFEGFILSTDKTPVSYATIIAKSSKSVFIGGTMSDEAGHFKISFSVIPDSLEIKCIGFEDKQISFRGLTDTIYLSPMVLALDEVVVKAKRPMIKLQGNTVQVHVQGTVLANETNLSDLLRKTPGLIGSNNEITTIEGYTPAIYLNGRKVSSLNEIKNVDIKSIKSISVDTAPGAKYGSTEKAVIDIKTSSFLEGLSVMAKTFNRLNSRYTHDNSVNISLKKESIRVFGGIGYSDYRKHSRQDISMLLERSNVEIHTFLNGFYNSDKELNYNIGLEYAKNNTWGLGIEYHGIGEVSNMKTKSNTDAYWRGSSDHVIGTNLVEDKTLRHHLNAYIQLNWTEKMLSGLHLDFFSTSGSRTQKVTETSSQSGNKRSLYNNGSKFTMISIEPICEYNASKRLSFEFGGEFLHVSGNSNQDANDTNVSRYNTTETTLAGFGTLNAEIDRTNVQIGIRYENVFGYIHNLTVSNQNLKPTSSNLFGNFSVSTMWGKTSHSLSLQNSVERPKFGWLNNFSYYSDHYTSQLGNPTLRPAISFQVQYRFFYNFLFFALGYTHTKDFIGNYFYTQPDSPNKLFATWMNYDRNQRFQATINMRYSFGFYHPNLTSSFLFDILSDERVKQINRHPLFYIDFNNDFSLPLGINLNVEYLYRSKAAAQIFLFDPAHIVNLGVTKSFLNGALDLSVRCKDLFNGDISRYNGAINQIHFLQLENQDRRSVSIDLTWRFNKNKYHYRGQSQEKTINRLQ